MTLFVSGVRLGSKRSQVGLLQNFLKHREADEIYLGADILTVGGGAHGTSGLLIWRRRFDPVPRLNHEPAAMLPVGPAV